MKPAEAAYIEPLKVYVTDYGKSANKLEFLYFEPDSPMHELMKTRAHVAYDVPCLKCELEGAKVLLEPLDCGDMTIAFVEEEGIAIELIERHKYRALCFRCGRTVSEIVRPLCFAVVCRLRDAYIKREHGF